MGDVLGYNDDPITRKTFWTAMLNYRGTYNLYKDSKDEWLKRISDRDKDMYLSNLESYIRKDVV